MASLVEFGLDLIEFSSICSIYVKLNSIELGRPIEQIGTKRLLSYACMVIKNLFV